MFKLVKGKGGTTLFLPIDDKTGGKSVTSKTKKPCV